MENILLLALIRGFNRVHGSCEVEFDLVDLAIRFFHFMLNNLAINIGHRN